MKYTYVYALLLMLAFCISCGGQDKTDQPKEKIDSKKLKYTTGVRSILEESKGNIWFGSYNEGVCLLHNGKLQYFTKENGLSYNQARSIYERCGTNIIKDKNNKIIGFGIDDNGHKMQAVKLK